MHLTIAHTSTYKFDTPASYGLQQLRLTPQSHGGQNVLNWAIEVEGGKIETTFNDHHANTVTLISFDPGATEVRVLCKGDVLTEDQNGVIGKQKGFIPLWLFKRATELTRATANVRGLVRGLRDDHDNDIALLHALSAKILDAVPYALGETSAATSADGALAHGAGVCQDHAHIFLAAARAMGFPARYVSGYLVMNDRIEQNATHAWAEAHVDDIGWVGFDVSNAISPDERYARVATGLDYTDAAPISGVRFGSGAENLTVEVAVAQQ